MTEAEYQEAIRAALMAVLLNNVKDTVVAHDFVFRKFGNVLLYRYANISDITLYYVLSIDNEPKNVYSKFNEKEALDEFSSLI